MRGRDAFSRSNPEEFGRMIDIDNLSQYCRFYEYSIEQCSKDAGRNPSAYAEDTFPYDFYYKTIKVFVRTNTHFILASIFASITVMCFFVNAIFVIFLLISRRELQFSIYIIVMQLSICYIMEPISQFLVNIPFYFSETYYGVPVARIAFVIDQLADFGAILFYLLMAINRLAMGSGSPLKRLFTGLLNYVIIFFIWLLALAVSAFTMYYGCLKTYEAHFVIFEDKCVPPNLMLYRVYQVIFYIYYALPLIAFMIYIYILKWRRNRKEELDLLVHSFSTLLLHTAPMGLRFLRIEFADPKVWYTFDMLLKSLDLLTGIIFVLIFAVGNRAVREAARNMCRTIRSIIKAVKNAVLLRKSARCITKVVPLSNK